MNGLRLRFFFMILSFTLFDGIKCFYEVELLEREFIDNQENRSIKNLNALHDIEPNTEWPAIWCGRSRIYRYFNKWHWQAVTLFLVVFFLSCKANARVKLAKTGHGPYSYKVVVICVVQLLFVLFYVLFVCKCVLPPGNNPIAVNKCINIINILCSKCSETRRCFAVACGFWKVKQTKIDWTWLGYICAADINSLGKNIWVCTIRKNKY